MRKGSENGKSMNFKNTVNFILIVALVVVPIALAVIEKTAAASLSLIALSFALVFWNLDKFSEFKGAGFAAKLNTAVSEAYAAIDEVKSLAISISSPVASLMAVSSSFQYLHLKYKLEYAEEIRSSLKELKISEEKINSALSALYDRVSEDHIRKALWALNDQLDEGQKIFKNYDEIDPDSWPLDAIKRESKKLGVNIDENIEEYEYFVQNKKLLKPENWQG
ncbi:hypothetical protein [Prosthecochloris sp. HL-130-GSB]|uniref:hypothetical protein n=1 Tax=Prosthecochloris sp. HL-130-GSB TaxID=1974213 RepID=UPI000A1C019C|nr:hypothetical protein [Prosthecochloris sp. HL-130-GSB]ARM31769.1 hypothetical protein B9H02_11300 [Prosthecochloris sp. HL-130-GSB]